MGRPQATCSFHSIPNRIRGMTPLGKPGTPGAMHSRELHAHDRLGHVQRLCTQVVRVGEDGAQAPPVGTVERDRVE